MKKFTDYTIFESAVVAELETKLSDDFKESAKIVSKNLGPKATNAFYLTLAYADNCNDQEIKDDAKNSVISVIPVGNNNTYLTNTLGLLNTLDKQAFANYEDGTKKATWLLYKTYLGKTIAKENVSDTLDSFNLYLRTFKNSWEKSWKEIEDDVNNMNSGFSKKELESTPVKTDEITNLEQTSAIEDAIKKEDTLLKDLIERAGLDKKKLADYVNLVINQSYKTVNTDNEDEQIMVWKKKVANGEPSASNFVLGISAMICGAFITGDKNTIKEVLNYLDTKAQEEIHQAKKKLLK